MALICTLKISVKINTECLSAVGVLSKETFKKGKPSIKQCGDTFKLLLFDKIVGEFPEEASKALSVIVKEKLATFSAMVGLDSHRVNHALAIVNIMGDKRNAFLVIFQISENLKDNFENMVIISPDMASLPGIFSIISKNTTSNIAESSACSAPKKSRIEISAVTSTNTIPSVGAVVTVAGTFQPTISSSSTPSSSSILTLSGSSQFGCTTTPTVSSTLSLSIQKSNSADQFQSILSSIKKENDSENPLAALTPSFNQTLASGGLYNCNRSSISDLPENILEKVNIFNNDEQMIRNEQNEINLLYEGSSSRGNTCNFLLGRTPLPQQSSSEEVNANENAPQHESPTDNEEDSDEEVINFSRHTLQRYRKRRRRDPIAHIGADANELLEDPADVSYRHFGLETPGQDVADVLFNNVPEPVVKKNELDKLFDLMSEMPQDKEKEPCGAIKCSMLPHQKRALHWMVERENSSELPPFWEVIENGKDYFNLATLQRKYWEKPECVHGGILADDMGLGKTLTAIALLLTNHIDGQPMFKKVTENKSSLPLSADDIDEEEKKLSINKKRDGYLKPSKTTKTDMSKPGFRFRQLYKSDIMKKGKKPKKVVKLKEKEDSLFSDDSDDDTSKRQSQKHVEHIIRNHFPAQTESRKRKSFNQAPERRSTLIICPMSVLSNWTNQFQQHIDPSVDLNIYVFYGPERVRDLNFLQKHDVILTTYGTITNDYKCKERKQKQSPLHDMFWLRIILDEGHVIRNARSQQTAAVMALNSSRRWLLTGTPIQNRMTDLWSILKFLRLEPFTNRKWWFKYVVESMKRKPKPGELVFNRVQKIIRHIAIRRMKTDKINGEPIVKLPERKIVIQKIKFSEDERKLYDAMQKDGKLVICKYFRMNAIMKNYANVLAIIMRLRQLCCHPNLCIKAVKKLQKAMEMMEQLGEQVQAEGGGDEEDLNAVISEAEREKLIEQLMQLLSSGDSEECSICLEYLQDPVITKCAHVFCQNCINEVIDTSENGASCPLCRAEIDQTTMVKVPQNNRALEEDGESENSADKENSEKSSDDDGEWHSSAKLDALMEILLMQRQNNPRMKSLVVSQFTSFLDVVEKPLKDNGFQFVRLDGTMSQGKRMRVIDEFQSDSDESPTIMLLSLTAGGVGLNLVAANRVFLLDPAWNPAIEEQCFDRCHRLGQTQDVLIIKFIVEDTVEDRMLILQKQKRELMERAFGISQASPEERRAAALRDIGTLLGIDFGRAARRGNVDDVADMPGPSNAPQAPPPRPDSPSELPIIPLGNRSIGRNRRNINL